MENHSLPKLDWIRTAQAAEMLGVSPSTLAKWRLNGEGPAFSKAGHHLFYSIAGINDWLASRLVKSTAQYETLAVIGRRKRKKSEATAAAFEIPPFAPPASAPGTKRSDGRGIGAGAAS